ncbi:MAG: 30S ribosomal protein S7 [Planctomycetota bacterium]
MSRKEEIMAGRITASESQLRPDPKYDNLVLAKFINCIMQDGKKTRATRVMYDAMDRIRGKLDKETDPEKPENELDLFIAAIENVKPFVEVRSKRIGGANYQVPQPVRGRRQQSLAFRWIIAAARKERGRPMAQRLADELYSAAKGEGEAMRKRDETHRMADANKAFAHFA